MYKPPLSKPVAPSERIQIVDIVRGFALFGVLLVNMLSFSGPYFYFGPWTLPATHWDRTVELLILTLGQGAFYSIFSFLFGLSYALQVNRAEVRGEHVARTARSRMILLLIFGLIHYFLIWDGDILVFYAAAGFFLPAFADTEAKKTLKWAIRILLSYGVLYLMVAFALGSLEDWSREATITAVAAEIEKFRTGSFAELALDRLEQWPLLLFAVFLQVPWFLGLFLVGLWAVKSGKLANWRNERLFMVGVLKISLPVAIASKGFLASTLIFDAGEPMTGMAIGLDAILSASLGVTYLCLIVLFFQRWPPDVLFLRHLEPVGRMALTNYLSQSLLAVIYFYGIGLGQYGQLGLGETCLLSLLLFGVQILFSRFWLDHFRFGPMEWLWRVLTYKARIG